MDDNLHTGIENFCVKTSLSILSLFCSESQILRNPYSHGGADPKHVINIYSTKASNPIKKNKHWPMCSCVEFFLEVIYCSFYISNILYLCYIWTRSESNKPTLTLTSPHKAIDKIISNTKENNLSLRIYNKLQVTMPAQEKE